MSVKKPLTQSDFDAAAEEVVLGNLPVSVRTVRARLGCGSHSTLNRFLADWRSRWGHMELESRINLLLDLNERTEQEVTKYRIWLQERQAEIESLKLRNARLQTDNERLRRELSGSKGSDKIQD